MNAPAEIQLPLLVARWKELKLAEAQAKDARAAVEAQILEHFPKDKTEGSVTDANVGVTATFKVTRKVDTKALQGAWNTLPEVVQRAFKWGAEVDTKQYKALQDVAPEAFAQAVAFVTTTPNKPSITIKE